MTKGNSPIVALGIAENHVFFKPLKIDRSRKSREGEDFTLAPRELIPENTTDGAQSHLSEETHKRIERRSSRFLDLESLSG